VSVLPLWVDVRIVIHGRVSAPSADRRMEDRGVRGCPNLEMGRAWLQLKGVAPTRVPCPISEGRIRGSGSDRSGSKRGETRERMRARYGIVQVNIRTDYLRQDMLLKYLAQTRRRCPK
jgi:hypothetical protein